MKHFNDYSEQDFLDAVVLRVRDGRGRAMSQVRRSCEYLTKEGLRCAVGLFIPAGHEAQRFNGGLYDLLRVFSDLPWIEAHRRLLSELQWLHDIPDHWTGTAFNRLGEENLAKIARNHGLTTKGEPSTVEPSETYYLDPATKLVGSVGLAEIVALFPPTPHTILVQPDVYKAYQKALRKLAAPEPQTTQAPDPVVWPAPCTDMPTDAELLDACPY